MAKENEEIQEEPQAVTVETTTVEKPAEEPAEEPAVKSARDVFNESVRGYAPDADYDNDENAYFESANKWISELQKKGAEYDKFSADMLKRFQEDPEDAEVFLRYKEGEPLLMAIAEVKGKDALSVPLEGEDGYDDFMKGVEENRKRSKANQDLVEELKKNSLDTEERFNELAKAEGWSDEDKQKFWDFMYGDLENISRGNFTPEIMDRYKKAYFHDADMDTALEQGKAEGRNEKIQVERKHMEGSGLPNAAGGANASDDVEKEAPRNNTADWLGQFQRRR